MRVWFRENVISNSKIKYSEGGKFYYTDDFLFSVPLQYFSISS